MEIIHALDTIGLVEFVVVPEMGDYSEEIAKLNARHDDLLRLYNSLSVMFGEQSAQLDAEMRQIKKQINRLELLGRGYNLIDLDFLFMRRADGSPVFAVFAPRVRSDKFSVTFTNSRSGKALREVSSHLSYLNKYYQGFPSWFEKYKLARRFAIIFGKEIEWTFSVRFGGVIPKEANDLIKQIGAKGNPFVEFEEVLLIAEVPEGTWSRDVVVKAIPERKDPLLVARHKSGIWVLLMAFDTTPFEELMSVNFTTGKD